MDKIEKIRKYYADELRFVSNIQSELLINAFSKVPREDFLGQGPWKIFDTNTLQYWSTENDDPRHLYHNVLVAIDSIRFLNNGSPSMWAALFDRLALKSGDKVIHIGCGTGYYSAILSEIVGKLGQVTAIEIDEDVCKYALKNLSSRSNVKVIQTNGVSYFERDINAIVVSAGLSRIPTRWLESLTENGCLILPLTSSVGQGGLVKITKKERGFKASFLSSTMFYNCKGGHDSASDLLIKEAFEKEPMYCVNSLRTDPHEVHESCYIHGEDYCFSKIKI
ncbi:MAG: class I SAM-dependent methyltransferase [Deltaproteobacteria bacterium]|jgi:protein-L-isoaspartate(D-aspartate) O-methyltransferase|nr:class I SAM-dependent methyltransferase [Deltaproteobacteria bacterium]